MKLILSALSLAACAGIAFAQPTPQSFQVQVHGSGEPLILIPGLACDGAVWNDTVARYQDRYQCHVLTLAGFSDTEPLESTDGFLEAVKEDLREYIASRRLDQPIIVGHSLGGFLGLSLASEDSGLLGGLVVLDSLPYFPAAMNPDATSDSTRAQAAATRDLMRSATEAQTRASQSMILPSMISDGDRIEEAMQWTLASDTATVAQAMFELSTTDLRPDLPQISIPTLVLGAWIGYQQYGATRASTEQVFLSQYQGLPSYRFEMTDHGKHFIMWDDPDFFFQHLDSFLSTH